MIIERKEPPSGRDEAESPDAPPAYDAIAPRPSPGFQRDEKSQGDNQTSPIAGPSTPRSPTAPNAGHTVESSSNKNWFGLGSWFSEKGTRKEVKSTIQGLMRDVVKEPSSPATVSVVQSCVEACRARGLSFETILSEKFIEGHSPLYWAIVKLPPLSSEPQDDQVRLLDILLSFPLNSTTRSEAYLACLLSSDQVLFQRLRHTPGFKSPSVSAAAEILLGETPEDSVVVENLDGDHGEFRVNWKIAQFQKRMRVVGGVGTEVVARGRIWCLAFTVLPRDTFANGTHVKGGSWVASVSLLSPSPPTHLEAQFSVSEPLSSQGTPLTRTPSPSYLASHSSTPHSLPQPPATQGQKDSLLRWPKSSKYTPKPPIRLPVKTSSMRLEAISPIFTKSDLREHVLPSPGYLSLVVPLSVHPNGDSLQFDGCTYIHPDESLSVTFDARLAKSNEGDCIIC